MSESASLPTHARPTEVWPMRLLLLAACVGIVGVFPLHAFGTPHDLGFRAFALALAGFGLITVAGVWTDRPWASWAVMSLVSLKLTVDVYGWATVADRRLALLSLVSALVNLVLVALVFRRGPSPRPAPGRLDRVYFACVLALAAVVGIWGMFLPGRVAAVLPFGVPPLHARFLGAMYLSGATFMLLALRAGRWTALRVVLPMIAIWTGMLGLVSLGHLAAFDWSRTQTWVWFAAYIGYPLLAAWIAWQQRGAPEPAVERRTSDGLRRYLGVQGALVTLLALALLGAPTAMSARWPWAITPLLAQIYSAPFLSYGLGSLLASRQPDRAALSIVLPATLVFSAGVLAASARHAGLFDPGRVATWLWFGAFGLATLALAWHLGRPAPVQPSPS